MKYKCYKCKELKDKKEFSRNKHMKNDVQGCCKSCRRLLDMERKQKRKLILNSSDWSDIDLKEQIAFNNKFSQYKWNATNRGYNFELSYEDFADLSLRPCKYCGRLPVPQFVHVNPIGICVINGIDRVDNNLGYTLDNCVSCCAECNFMKKAMSIENWYDCIFRLVNHNKYLIVPAKSQNRLKCII